MMIQRHDRRKNLRLCKVCGVELTNNKTKKKEYCKDHDPRKAWHRLERRFLNMDMRLIKKADRLEFNLAYELMGLKDLMAQVNGKRAPDCLILQERLERVVEMLRKKLDEIQGDEDGKE